jgi:acetyl-CoA acetyltransferase
MSDRVEVAGVGLHPFGRFGDTTVTEMGVTAVQAALADAGLPVGQPPPFQAAFCGTAYAGVAAGHKVLGALGLTGTPIVDVEAGCASGGAALMLAGGAIRAGQYDTVLVFGIEKMPKGIIRSTFFEPWREEAGLAATPSYFALRAQRLMRESSVTKEHLAQVVVKNRRNGVDNPNAMFRAEVTPEEVLASRVVCEPLHLWMLCSPNEGAAAVVLRAADGPRRSRSVTLEAAVLRSHLPGSVLGEATPMSGIVDDDFPSPTTLAARAAYEEAGLGPDDFDVVECQDTDAARELLGYEELELCPRGDAGKWAAEGITTMHGRLPVNPSGGLLSKGEPLGASALGQVVELTEQLRGRAGSRQVDDAHVGLAHTVGRGANASVTILSA